MMKSTPAAEVKIENVEESPGVLTSAIAAGGGVLKGIGSYVVSPTIEMVTGGSARDLQKTTPLASSVMMKEAMHHAAQDMATGKAKVIPPPTPALAPWLAGCCAPFIPWSYSVTVTRLPGSEILV